MKSTPLNGIAAFVKVAEKKSFSRAALELGVSPSALSQSIKLLESQLGIALLSRTTRSLSLTESGEQLYAQTAPALRDISNAVSAVGPESGRLTGTLRITMPETAFDGVIEPVLGRFKRLYPLLTVESYIEDGFDNIVEGGFDAGIRLSESVEKDMVAVRLTPPFAFAVAAAPKYLKQHGEPKSVEDLLQHNCFRYRFKDGELYDRWEFQRKGKDFTILVNGNSIYNTPNAALKGALEGFGLFYQSEPFLRKHVDAGKLVLVLQPHYTLSEGFFLYYPSRNQVAPKLRAFIDFLKTEIPKRRT